HRNRSSRVDCDQPDRCKRPAECHRFQEYLPRHHPNWCRATELVSWNGRPWLPPVAQLRAAVERVGGGRHIRTEQIPGRQTHVPPRTDAADHTTGVTSGPGVLASSGPFLMLRGHRDDLAVTTRLREAGRLVGVELLDHLIVGAEGWVSLKERGAM